MFGAFVFRKSSHAPPPARLVAANVPANGQGAKEDGYDNQGQDASHEDRAVTAVDESHLNVARDPLESDPKKRKL